MFDNVVNPAPGRRLRHIIAAPEPGKRFCRHWYEQTGWHEACDGGVRYSVRHYGCIFCGRLVWVDGRKDVLAIDEMYDKRLRAACRF